MRGVSLKTLSVLLIFFTLSFGQEEDSILKTPLTKKLDKYNVSIGVVGIEELKEKFKSAYDLLVKHNGELHQQGENYSQWFQMNDRGFYSITIYITEEI
jgi:hypothetical protein